MTNLILDISGSIDDTIFKYYLKKAGIIDKTFNVFQADYEIKCRDYNVSDLKTIQKYDKKGSIFDYNSVINIVTNLKSFNSKNPIYIFTDIIFDTEVRRITTDIDIPITIIYIKKLQGNVPKNYNSKTKIKIIPDTELELYIQELKCLQRKEKLLKLNEYNQRDSRKLSEI